jgi:hypothetical protein
MGTTQAQKSYPPCSGRANSPWLCSSPVQVVLESGHESIWILQSADGGDAAHDR